MRPRPLAAALLLAACGSKIDKPQSCQSKADCPPDTFCRGAICVAGAAPVAAVTSPPRPHLTYTKLVFGGAGSRDPDPEDHVASLRWTARKIQADCDPYPAAASGNGVDTPFFTVIQCPGTFEVRLVAVDGTGRESAPAVVPLAVEPSSAVPTITMGADQAFDHVCTAGPLLCTVAPASRTVPLQAAAASPVSTGLQYEWFVTTPTGMGVAPRVTFAPGAAVPAPTAAIETDGTAIAGEYTFSVVASDDRVAVVGHQRVTVRNRPPRLAGVGSIEVPHRFDATTTPPTFRAQGTATPAQASDPDGDPLETSFTSTGVAGTTFDVIPRETSADFFIAVPYRGPEDSKNLIAPGLSRTITLTARDPNGGEAQFTWDIAVGNRLPRMVSAPGAASVSHTFDAARRRYLALASLGDVVDDDGDPIAQGSITGDAVCTEISTVVGAGRPTVTCALPYLGVPRADLFSGDRRVQVVLADPFGAEASFPFLVSIQNRAPVLTARPEVPVTSCVTSRTCCDFDPIARQCLAYDFSAGSGSGHLDPAVTDPDGDPLAFRFDTGGCGSATPASFACTMPDCPGVDLTTCAYDVCGAGEPTSVRMSASDGALSAADAIYPACP